mgnify:FL=1|jgi:hypothetical protein
MLFKRRTKQVHDGLTQAEHPWQGCIGVCSKCARKVHAMDGGKTRLRVGLKALIGLRGIKKQVRPVDISCLDVCPENSIAVAHFTQSSIRVINVGRDVTPETVLKELGY